MHSFQGGITVAPASDLNESQRNALLSSPGPARFKHFIGRAADCERLWGLRDADAWVFLADDTGAPGFPVWPHPDYATACATGTWAGCFPAEIDVYAFTEKWLPDMAAREVSVAVFPTPTASGVWIKSEELRQYLVDELEKYE
nr:DUF2750 domain-containing protein [Massilia sp. IC2-476]